MTPLMDREFYERLRALRQEMERAGVHPPNIAHVFVPVGPDAGAVPGLPRVLFVGQATRGYGEPEVADFDSAFERGAELVLSKSFPTGRTAFWRFARGVMRGVALGLKHPAAGATVPAITERWETLDPLARRQIRTLQPQGRVQRRRAPITRAPSSPGRAGPLSAREGSGASRL